MREAALDDLGGARRLDAGWFVGERTEAMTGAMSALFALRGDRMSEIKEFREKVLPGRFLSADEAHELIASYAASALSLDWFEKWNIPLVGHSAEVPDPRSDAEYLISIDARMTIRVDPPGITKTVRYARPREGAPNTRCCTREGAVIPIHAGLPIEDHGHYQYPSWLWPGSVVDELYDLSVKLVGAFDCPGGFEENLWGTRSWSRVAAWFVLTGEAPEVRPIEARWQEQQASPYLDRQWCVQLTKPPWLPEEEVLRALRTLRRLKPKGHQMPKTAKPLEVTRFVWERERLYDNRKPRPWTAWWKQWNDEHPEDGFKTASNFRTYFVRGKEAVEHLNFDWPDVKPYWKPGAIATASLDTMRQAGEENTA